MKKEFVTYIESIELKELGFDEPCFGYYEPNKNLNYIERHILKDFPYLAKNSEWQDLCSAPTFSQAFRWFRKKYKYDITIPPSGDSNGNTIGYYYEIIFQGWGEGIESDSYDTYEEAELECIRQLIKIAKEKK